MNIKNNITNKATTIFEQQQETTIIQKSGSSIEIKNNGIIINSESGKLHFLNQ